MKLSDAVERVLCATPEDLSCYLAHCHLLPPEQVNTVKVWAFWEMLMGLTSPIRRRVACLLAPKSFKCNSIMYEVLSAVPRPMTVFLKVLNGDRGLVGAEIGVAAGDNALSLLKTLNVKQLYLIDPYAPYREGGAVLRYDHLVKLMKQRLASYPQVHFIRCFSQEAKVGDGLDFVYIDGNHSYEAVKLDIERFYPQVRAGGLIGGHDYTPLNMDVVRAVDEFANKHDRSNFYAVFPDWWIIKS